MSIPSPTNPSGRRHRRRTWLYVHLAGMIVLSSLGCSTLEPLGNKGIDDTNSAVDLEGIGKSQAEMALAKAESSELQGDDEEAIRYYEETLRFAPDQTHLYRRLAVLYDRQGKDRQANAAYQAALENSATDPELLNDYGVFHLHREQWSMAETWLRRALEASPGHARATVNLATALAMQGQLEEAFHAFDSVVGPAAAYSNLGVLLARQGRDAESQVHFRRALELDSSIQVASQFLSELSAQDTATTQIAEQPSQSGHTLTR